MTPQPAPAENELVYRSLDGEEARLSRTLVDELRAAVRGAVSVAGDPEYERARHVWNAMVDHHPALVVHASSARDVCDAVRFAHRHSMLLSVRGGGHHIAGNAIAEGGLTIDLSRMRGVRVDPARRTARVSAGALLGDVDHECQGFGLATPLGINSTTGFSGLCLGGGFGWLTRKYGLTIDNLLGADVVTADGAVRTVSASSQPDLFWAIRGGGGNFGVVTSFEIALHPVGPLVHAGLVVYPGSQARRVLAVWRDFMESAPDELTVWCVLRKAPPLPFLPAGVHGTDVLVLALMYAGDPTEGAKYAAPVLGFGTPVGQHVGPMPYEAFQTAFDPLLAFGARNYWKTNEFVELPDAALDAVAEGATSVPGPACELFVAALGGAMGRVPSDATAYAGRDTRFVMNAHARWESPADDAAVRAWARGVFAKTAPFATGGGYVNFLSADDTARVEAAYSGNYERLRALKRRFDPDNLFRVNHNIPPGDGERRTSRGVGRRPRAGA